MDGRGAVASIVRASGRTGADVVRALGYDGEYPGQYAGKIFNERKNMDIGLAARILGVVGYCLVAVPKGRKLPDGSVVIGDE